MSRIILGLCNHEVATLAPSSGVAGTTASLFRELATTHDVTLEDCRLPAVWRGVQAAHGLLVGGAGWRGHANKSLWSYDARSRVARRSVDRHACDLVVQRQGLFSVAGIAAPYLVYTDYTAALEHRNRGWPTAFHTREGLVSEWMARERESYRGAACVCTYSELVRRSMIEDYGVDPERVHTVGVGVRMEPAQDERCFDRPRVVFVGHDDSFERKGGPNLVRAFERVRTRLPNAELVLVGVSPRRALGRSGVRATGRVRDRAQVAALLDEAALFAMTPRMEPYGQVFLEAMMRRLPCVGSDVGALPEIVEDGVTGRLVPPEEPDQLAEVLVELLDDPARLRDMGDRGYRKVVRGHAWRDVAERIRGHLP